MFETCGTFATLGQHGVDARLDRRVGDFRCSRSVEDDLNQRRLTLWARPLFRRFMASVDSVLGNVKLFE